MWDEANATFFWGNPTWSQATSAQELYYLVKPVIPTIQANVIGAQITTPSISTATGYQTWMQDWLSQEMTNGIISNLYNIHNYLANQTPESRWLSGIVASELSPNFNTTGWSPLPWVTTETNFNGSTFACTSTTVDCTGQIVRWQLLLDAGGPFYSSGSNANGTLSVDWYYWNYTIGNDPVNPQFRTAYTYMMQYLTGGSFSQPCAHSSDNTTWNCSFTESNATADKWVWTTNMTGTYSVTAGQYKHYRDLSGNRAAISNTATSVSITQEPILLETY
jgi:hypothetical protein